MAHSLSKEAFFSPSRMMASFHWRTLIEEGFLPTIPRCKALIDHRPQLLAAPCRQDTLPARKKGILTMAVPRRQTEKEAVLEQARTGRPCHRDTCCATSHPVHGLYLTGRTTLPTTDEESICDSTTYSSTHPSSLTPANTPSALKSNKLDD